MFTLIFWIHEIVPRLMFTVIIFSDCNAKKNVLIFSQLICYVCVQSMIEITLARLAISLVARAASTFIRSKRISAVGKLTARIFQALDVIWKKKSVRIKILLQISLVRSRNVVLASCPEWVGYKLAVDPSAIASLKHAVLMMAENVLLLE